jgi:hypothetical protein
MSDEREGNNWNRGAPLIEKKMIIKFAARCRD